MELPIDEILPRIPSTGNVVIEAAPGAGKTTRVPSWLLDKTEKEVFVLEPRRLAARLAARRVAEERGEKVGETVGYQVRFEDHTSAKTRLRYLTEGVLNRRMGQLERVGTVVLDEFHERHMEGDLALALLLEMQRTKRPDLRLIVMSATLDAAPIAEHLGGCPVLRSEGRLFPLEVRYTPASSQTLEERVAAAVETACRERPTGDILIFLPGAAEIRRAISAVGGRHGLLCLPLSGDLSPEEQDRAVTPQKQRKAIFATNVAESSVTIPGVSIVIDAGLARMASDSRTTGLPLLTLGKISQASAIQRAGRAARTGPGLAIRLYTEQDFLSRAARGTPEIVERELSGLLLQLRAMGVGDPLRLPWMTRPREDDLARASALLDELGATGETARHMAAMPVHPRLARMMMEAEKRQVAGKAAGIAALLSSGDRPKSPDLIHASDQGLSPNAQRIARQLARGPRDVGDWEKPLAESILAAYPDRVAKKRKGEEYEIAGGIAAKLASEAEWIVAVDVEERSDQGLAAIRAACPIEADWLLELFPQSVESVERYTWNRQTERVEEESAMLFHGLVLDRTVNPRPQSAGAAAALAGKVREAGWRKFLDVEATEALLARVDFAKWPEPDLASILSALCEGRNGFDQVREAVTGGEWDYRLREVLDLDALERIAPERVKIPGGRTVRVHYTRNQVPWIESRLQDFWGMTETPKVGGVPVLVHLLAPNKRPVQMTQDLASFWQKLYPELRTQLSRRYPKHTWP